MDFIKETAKKIADRHKIDPAIFDIFVSEGLMDEKSCRDFLIRTEAQELKDLQSQTAIKINMADKYSVSYSTAEKIILKKFE